MWQEIDSVVPEVIVLRRLLFATAHLSKECPKYWNIVTKFSFGSCDNLEDVKVLVENLEFLDSKAFETDQRLLKVLHSAEGYHKQPLGIVLISSNTTCRLCGGKLLVRVDRPSSMTVYTDDMGTVNATPFHKYCQNSRKQCHFTQYYGFTRTVTAETSSLTRIGNNTSIWYPLPKWHFHYLFSRGLRQSFC